MEDCWRWGDAFLLVGGEKALGGDIALTGGGEKALEGGDEALLPSGGRGGFLSTIT